MKILFTRFPLESAHGGAELQTLSLLKGFAKRGHAVSFLGSCPVLLEMCKKEGISAVALSIGKPPVTKMGAISFAWRKQKMQRTLETAICEFGELDVICMLSMTEKILLTPFAAKQGIKVFWIEHDRCPKETKEEYEDDIEHVVRKRGSTREHARQRLEHTRDNPAKTARLLSRCEIFRKHTKNQTRNHEHATCENDWHHSGLINLKWQKLLCSTEYTPPTNVLCTLHLNPPLCHRDKHHRKHDTNEQERKYNKDVWPNRVVGHSAKTARHVLTQVPQSFRHLC